MRDIFYVKGVTYMKEVMKFVNWFRVHNNADLKQFDFAEPLTQMKVMKLLYYVQGVSLAVDNEKAFPEKIVAWKYGPAVEEVHKKYIGQRNITGTISQEDLDDYHEIEHDPKLRIVVNAVQSSFGDKSAIELMHQTHHETPWKETPQSNEILPQLMKEFFLKEVVEVK